MLTFMYGNGNIYMKFYIGGESVMKYTAPEMKVVMFETEEVIVASTATTTTEEDVVENMED